MTNLIDSLHDAAQRLHTARSILANVEADLAESRATLATAERRLDEMGVRLQAAAPRDQATNEVQRRAYAILGTAGEAAEVEALRVAHLANEQRRIRARAAVQAAEDVRTYLQSLMAAAALPADFYVPALLLPETAAAVA